MKYFLNDFTVQTKGANLGHAADTEAPDGGNIKPFWLPSSYMCNVSEADIKNRCSDQCVLLSILFHNNFYILHASAQNNRRACVCVCACVRMCVCVRVFHHMLMFIVMFSSQDLSDVWRVSGVFTSGRPGEVCSVAGQLRCGGVQRQSYPECLWVAPAAR